MHARNIPTNKYSQRSIAEMARDLVATAERSPEGYVPLSDFKTLEFAAPRRSKGPMYLALLLFVAGSAAAYFTNRAYTLALPTCDQRVTECGR